MKRSLVVSFVVGVVLSLAATGHAAPPAARQNTTPVLTGTYVYTWFESCRRTDTGALSGNGQTTGLLTFNPATSVVTLSGFQPSGLPLTLLAIAGAGTYSNTTTTFTLDADTFQAFYGDVAKDGTANYMSYIGVVNGEPGSSCSDQGQLVRQTEAGK